MREEEEQTMKLGQETGKQEVVREEEQTMKLGKETEKQEETTSGWNKCRNHESFLTRHNSNMSSHITSSAFFLLSTFLSLSLLQQVNYVKTRSYGPLGAIHKGRPQNLTVLTPPPARPHIFCLLKAKINSSVQIWQTPPSPLYSLVWTSFMDYP